MNIFSFAQLFLISTCSLFVQSSRSVSPTKNLERSNHMNIVFVYTIVPSNFLDCSKIQVNTQELHGLKLIDTTSISSYRTKLFHNLSRELFSSDYGPELWLTSAVRLLLLEDIMRVYSMSEILHVEADNLLYGPLSVLLPTLRQHYPLAATPLTTTKAYITASVLWISSLASIIHLNDYLLSVAQHHHDREAATATTAQASNITTHTPHQTVKREGPWQSYLDWLYRYACCKKHGVDSDHRPNQMGIKPYAINEMTLLGYYHHLYPHKLRFLPVVPIYQHYVNQRPFADLRTFTIEGRECTVGGPSVHSNQQNETVPYGLGHGIWDSNSWGQYLGGTSRKKGRDKGFVDISHISDQAISISGCRPSMTKCANSSVDYIYGITGVAKAGEKQLDHHHHYRPAGQCYTVPVVSCGDTSNSAITSVSVPLWNVHVHSKNTRDFYGVPCPC